MDFESELKELRKEVDMADKKILEALSTRFIVTNMIWKLKHKNNVEIIDEQRKQFKKDKFEVHWVSLWLDENFCWELYELIHKYSVKYQNKN